MRTGYTTYKTFGHQPHETVFGTLIKPRSGEMTNRLKKDSQEVEFEFIPKENEEDDQKRSLERNTWL